MKRNVQEVVPLLKERENPQEFIIQITTKGGEMEVIIENLEYLNKIFQELPDLISDRFRIEILTEKMADKEKINLGQFAFPLEFYVVPDNYQTPNGTKLKARALHYMIKLRKSREKTSLENLFIIHFDAESCLKKDGVLSIVYSILTNSSKTVLQGPIIYPNHWFEAGLLSRQMESLRPWNCYECYRSTTNGVPYHLHGSNIVIRADVEEAIGWDFGQVYGYPVVAEDLFFGIKAYLKYGEGIFGWHGAEMHEQPAFSLIDSLKQRVRWIRGSLQAIKAVPDWPEYTLLNDTKRKKFLFKMKFKIFFYALGFIPATVAIMMFLIFIVTFVFQTIASGNPITLSETANRLNDLFMPMVPAWMLRFSVLGAILWLFSIQVGLYHNIKHLKLTPISRLLEHIKILVITPFATLFDTGVVFFTVLSWIFGNREANWEVTPKSITNL